VLPTLFKIGNISIHTYGVLIAIGFIVSLKISQIFAVKEGINKELIYDFAVFVLIFAIIGARIFYIFEYHSFYFKHPFEIFKIWKGGLVFYGGLIFGIIAVIINVKRYKLNLWKIGDIFLVALPLGQFFGRLGCLSAGCCYGKPCNLPWAIKFTNEEALAPKNIYLHPTEIYHALANLTIFFILFFYYKKGNKKFDGEIALLYGMLYSIGRFIIEFYRGDYRGHIWIFSIPQIISIIIFWISLIIYFIKRRKSNEKTFS